MIENKSVEKQSKKQFKKNPISNLKGKGFKKGQSGNPAGRPKKELCIPDILRKILSEKDPGTKKTKLDLICDTAIIQAVKGDKDARNWIADRTEGKALERVIKQKVKDEIIIE